MHIQLYYIFIRYISKTNLCWLDHTSVRVQGVQIKEATLYKANQALRIRREEKDLWRILNIATSLLVFITPRRLVCF